MEAFCANVDLGHIKFVLSVLKFVSCLLRELESSLDKEIFLMKHEQNVRILPSIDTGILH